MIDTFKKMVFFSLKTTETLSEKLYGYQNYANRKADLQGLYHFEAKYFQYCVLQNNVRFIKDVSKNIEYFVFKFGHSKHVYHSSREYEMYLKLQHNQNASSTTRAVKKSNSYSHVPLYGVCEVNDILTYCSFK